MNGIVLSDNDNAIAKAMEARNTAFQELFVKIVGE